MPRTSPSIGSTPFVLLSVLLIAPAWALSRVGVVSDWRWLLAGVAAVSAFTFLAYRSDKRRAERGEWRVPETTLHLLELVGGWPGAFLAQLLLRHKNAKATYQLVFWQIVLAHQFAAVDFLLGWRFTGEVARALGIRP